VARPRVADTKLARSRLSVLELGKELGNVAEARLERLAGNNRLVRRLDCLDGTSLLDLKADCSLFIPIVLRQAEDFQVGS